MNHRYTQANEFFFYHRVAQRFFHSVHRETLCNSVFTSVQLCGFVFCSIELQKVQECDATGDAMKICCQAPKKQIPKPVKQFV